MWHLCSQDDIFGQSRPTLSHLKERYDVRLTIAVILSQTWKPRHSYEHSNYMSILPATPYAVAAIVAIRAMGELQV